MLALTPSQQKMALIETDLLCAVRAIDKAAKAGDQTLANRIAGYMRTKLQTARAAGLKLSVVQPGAEKQQFPLLDKVEAERSAILRQRLAKERRMRAGYVATFGFTQRESVFTGLDV